jgi:hypothetical protein
MNNVEELSNFGEEKIKFIECYLEKCENYYSSYYDADQDEDGCKKLAEDCAF